MRVLHIDDDEDLRNLVSGYIRDYWPDAHIDGYDPMECDLPSTSFSLRPYDLIVLDYMLGRGDGLQWLEALKQRDDCPKVLFLTGAGNETIAVRAIKTGADDYQRKQDLTREKLIESIRQLTTSSVVRTVSPDLAARMEGDDLGAKVRIPGIQVLHMIGQGATARVYLASRKDDDEPLVVKILRDDALNSTAIDRFMEEYAMVECIQSPHVARILGHGKHQNNTYLVMEFFDGGDLAKRLGGKPMPPPEALQLFRELMFALGDIHEKGILHRDLKPQNVMFRRDGTLAIVDFGIAKNIAAADRTGAGEMLGTPRYMSPEQVLGRALDLAPTSTAPAFSSTEYSPASTCSTARP